jgi:chromosome segregation ATPase
MEREIIKMQETKLQNLADKIEELTNLIGNLQTSCALRHKTDLALQLVGFGKDLEQITAELNKIHLDQADIKKEYVNLLNRLSAAEGKYNILTIKIDELTAEIENKKSNKVHIITEIIVAVAAFIIVSLLSWIGQRVITNMNVNTPPVQIETHSQKIQTP